MSAVAKAYFDESTPVHEDIGRRHPMVVFGDHRFCAGKQLEVRAMPGPHMHSQVEINFVLQGAMTYWFDGRVVEIGGNGLCLFWGMVPHRVTDAAPGTTFACFYVPIATILTLPAGAGLRDALLRGAVVEASRVRENDRDSFVAWREELLSGDARAEPLVRDEMLCRLRRIDREGWRDLRATAPLEAPDRQRDADRMAPIETMSRYIGEHGSRDIDVDDVARAAGLHPNYAMQLFKRAVGITIKQAIIRHRLDAAQSMLIATDRPVSEIAFDSGFGSLSSFYEAFEKRFTRSPNAFRHAVRAPTREPEQANRDMVRTLPSGHSPQWIDPS